MTLPPYTAPYPHGHHAAPQPQQKRARDGAAIKGLGWLEELATFWLILHFSGAVLALVLTDQTALAQESSFMRLLWYPSYIIIAVLILKNFTAFIRMVVFNPLIIICVIWCGLSFFWSIAPDVTMRRVVAIVMTTSFGLLLAAKYNWYELVQRLAVAYGILIIISFIFAIALPEYGRMQFIHEGTWRGTWLEKNSFGAQMAKALLIMMCAFAMKPKRGYIWVPLGILAFLAIILSTSKTALLGGVMMIAGMVFVRIMRANPVLRIPVMYVAIVGCVGLAFGIIFMPEEMFGLIGKDPSLTGRTQIWDGLIRAIEQRPWLGYGYGTFWADPLGPSYWVRFELDWGVPTAHNGWIETWLSVGFVGIAIFSVTYLITVILGLDRLARGGVENYWVLLSTLLFAFLSLSESTILQQNHLDWVIFVATTAKMFSFAPAYWRDGRPVTSYWQLRSGNSPHTALA
ncbi:O-antigen ligase family protein [Robiginitomaculum antarcticum]|uniref:O-antigen ligase family protein n=1 Tax=Robiginitomaculum antarcticum TaxID=437507 RepID=UPI00037E7748|nr:O-antigen ligase [Robiginitomaculum antarcticum]